MRLIYIAFHGPRRRSVERRPASRLCCSYRYDPREPSAFYFTLSGMSNAARDARASRRYLSNAERDSRAGRDTRAEEDATRADEDAMRFRNRDYRLRISAREKCKILDAYHAFASNPAVRFPFTETCKWAFGAIWKQRTSYLSRWLTQEDLIRRMAPTRARCRAASCHVGMG
jgi:hypothetical protein